MTILTCDCNGERACAMHAEELYNTVDHADPELAEAHTQSTLDGMIEEAKNNPDMALALLSLYGDDVYSHEDYWRDVKADTKRECACNGCANDAKWFNQ